MGEGGAREVGALKVGVAQVEGEGTVAPRVALMRDARGRAPPDHRQRRLHIRPRAGQRPRPLVYIAVKSRHQTAP